MRYRVNRQAPLSANPLDLGENTGTGAEDDNPPLRNALTGAGYDFSRGVLDGFQKVRRAGDCGALATWIFGGAKFVLAEKQVQGACSGLLMDNWPWLYRTKTRGVCEPGLSRPSQARSAMWRSSRLRPCVLAVGIRRFMPDMEQEAVAVECSRVSQSWQRVALRSASTLLLALAGFLGTLPEGWAMGVFSRLVLFSEVHGTVLKEGKPVAGAELLQKVVWSDDEDKSRTQHTVTDSNGAFGFTAIESNAGLLRLIPAQPTIQQTIVIRYQGVEYVAWLHGKGSYNANTELDGRPLHLVCELTRQPDYEGKHYGICRAV